MINSWRFIRVGSKYSREIRYFLWNDNHRSKILPNKKCPQQNILQKRGHRGMFVWKLQKQPPQNSNEMLRERERVHKVP